MCSVCDDQAPRQAFEIGGGGVIGTSDPFCQLFTNFFFKKNLIQGGGAFPHAARLVMIV